MPKEPIDNYRVPKTLSKRVKAIAKSSDPKVSANALVVSFVKAGVTAHEARKGATT